MNNTNRTAFSEFRMATWGEDISLNHQNSTPFENTSPPSEMPRSDFNLPSHLNKELLAGVPLDEFIARDNYPIPSADDREGYNKNYNAAFFLNGLADYLKICQTAKKYQIEMQSYFDFGCASGRVLRHFCAQSDVKKLWGSDINGRHIKWLNDYLPAYLKLIHNHCIPNLQIADNSIDVISAFSVFTHIDTFETAWLAELYRILSPDGMVYLTVQNDDTWKFLQDVKGDDALLNRIRNISPNIEQMLKSDLPEGRTDFRFTDVGPYRALVFHCNHYLQKTWGRFFNICEIIPRGHGHYQSVFVGRKKA